MKKLYRNHNMYKKIGWIAEKEKTTVAYGNTDASLRSEYLIYYIVQQQRELDIPKQYCIDISNETEKANVEEILNVHKNDVVKSYFHDFLKKDKVFCKLNSLEYYMFSLNCFLQKNLENYEYIDKIYSSREYTDKTHYHRQLTDYGRTYYKLYLITKMFCKENEKTKMLIGGINSNSIMENLKNNKVEFWSYRD